MIRRVAAQARIELLLTLRRGESLLVTVAIPVAVLVFFTIVDVLPHPGEAVDFLVPGILGLAVAASGMVSLGIATGFERRAGVLKRLTVTPLGTGGLVAAKAAATLGVVVVQAGAIVGAGLALGWRPAAGSALAVPVLGLGVAAFSAIGLTLAGLLRAETNLAVTNGLFLLVLLVGGVVVPVDRLPQTLEGLARLLPAEPLVSLLRDAFSGRGPGLAPLLTLAGWAVFAGLLAPSAFRWE